MPYRVEYRPAKERPGEPWAKIDEHGHIVSRHRTKRRAHASIRAYYATRNSLTLNVTANPLAVDPTRTLTIRRAFIAEMNKAFKKLRGHVNDFMVVKDALGLGLRKSLVPFERISGMAANVQPREYEFRTDSQKLTAFNDWFKQQVEADVLSPDPGTPVGTPWTTEYVESAYKKGQINAYLSTKQTGSDIGDMSQEEFLRSSFGAPESTSKVQLLATRTFENMKGVTETMKTQMNQILAQGIADGSSPVNIAREMNSTISGLTRTRALTIARTEVIHAHAEGQLDAFTKLGISELGIKAEWSTAGDDRVCEECAKLEGQTFTIEEARGLIPYHPNCRCTWIPSQVAEKKEEEKPKSFQEELDALFSEMPKKGYQWDVEDVEKMDQKITSLLEKRREGSVYIGKIFRNTADASIAPQVAEAETWLRRVVPEKRLTYYQARVETIKGRAYYTGSRKTLSIDPTNGADVVIHEYGHHLQQDGRIFRSEKAFLKKRAKITSKSVLKTINGMPGEQGFPGDFKSKGGSDYTGRIYNATKDAKGNWDWTHGEVLSMGIQRLYSSPSMFYLRDPEYFLWTTKMIQGK